MSFVSFLLYLIPYTHFRLFSFSNKYLSSRWESRNLLLARAKDCKNCETIPSDRDLRLLRLSFYIMGYSTMTFGRIYRTFKTTCSCSIVFFSPFLSFFLSLLLFLFFPQFFFSNSKRRYDSQCETYAQISVTRYKKINYTSPYTFYDVYIL